MAALQNSAAPTDVDGVSFTTLQQCPRELSVNPTQVLGTATHSPSIFRGASTSSTPLAFPVSSLVHSASASTNTAVQPSSTPVTVRPTGSKPIPIAALAAGISGGVTLITLVGLCLGAAAILKIAKSEKDTPKPTSTQQQENSYEEVDNESIMGPDRVFHSMYEVDNISIATRITHLTTDTIYTSVDGLVTEQFLCQEMLLGPPYSTLNSCMYVNPNTCADTESSLRISPYQVVSQILMENGSSSQFQETTNPYAEPDVDNSRNKAETGAQGSKINPYQVLEITGEEETEPQLQEMSNLYAEPDGGSDTETGTQGSRVNPYRVSRVLLEDETDTRLLNGTNHKQYSSLDRHTQYATLEPFTGSLSKDIDRFEDGYSRLNHSHPTTQHTPDPSTIMETPV